MQDLALNIDELMASFSQETDSPFLLVRVPEEQANAFSCATYRVVGSRQGIDHPMG